MSHYVTFSKMKILSGIVTNKMRCSQKMFGWPGKQFQVESNEHKDHHHCYLQTALTD
jgi:hypothetical protein